jgi:hypothetical protein
MGGGNLTVRNSSPTPVTIPSEQTGESKLNSDLKTRPQDQEATSNYSEPILRKEVNRQWSMTPVEHMRQWKDANPGSTEPPPIAFTTRDGRVVVNEVRWVQSGQPALWYMKYSIKN